MGLLGKIVGYVASEVAENVAFDSLSKTSKRKKNKLFEGTDTGTLIIDKHWHSWRGRFDIYDENRNVKYTAKGEVASIKHHLHIYDAEGKRLGMVKEKLIALRLPIFHELNPVDLVIEVDGKRLGEVNSIWSYGKRKYEVDFNGWRIEANILGNKYTIFDGDNEIAHISREFIAGFSEGVDTCVVTFPDNKNEFIVLMIAIALEIENTRKELL